MNYTNNVGVDDDKFYNNTVKYYTTAHENKIKRLYSTTNWYGNRDQYNFQLEKDSATSLEDILITIGPKTVLDYGSGNGLAIDRLKELFPNIQFTKYDPFVPTYSARPTEKFDLVVSHRVLRSVEPEFKAQVINDMHNYANQYLLLEILLYDVDNIPVDYYNDLLSNFNIVKKGVNDPVLRQGSDGENHYVANAGFFIKK